MFKHPQNSVNHSLHPGQWVKHVSMSKWGIGKVVDCCGVVRVEFVEFGIKSFVSGEHLLLVDIPLDANGKEFTPKELHRQNAKDAALRKQQEEAKRLLMKQEENFQRALTKPNLIDSETADVLRQENESDRHEGGRYR